MKIGETLAYLVAPGEAPPFELAKADDKRTKRRLHQRPKVLTIRRGQRQRSNVRRSRAGGPAISPRAKRVALELGVDWSRLTGSGSSGRIVERDIRAAATDPGINISPVARRVAQEAGIALAELAARFPGVRITRADVEKMAAERASDAVSERQPLSRIRQIDARPHGRKRARDGAGHLDDGSGRDRAASDAAQLKSRWGRHRAVLYNDLLAKLVAAALTEHPALNASIEGDELLLHSAINLCLAVDSERGLLAPVIRDADRLSPLELAAISADLIKRAREGKIAAEELQGGTFTITNLGMYDIDAFTPIINLPQCAILGVGRLVPRQVVIDAEAQRLAIRQMMTLSLTFDHRAVDGAPAARFLQRVKQYIESPYLWLVN